MPTATFNAALKLVDPKWREAFRKFVETGDGSQEFRDYLDNDQNCQKAIDMVFNEQAAAFDKLFDAMRQDVAARRAGAPGAVQASQADATLIAEKLKEAVKPLVGMTRTEQDETTRQIAESFGFAELKQTREALAAIEQGLSSHG
jgi:hypothetical protein